MAVKKTQGKKKQEKTIAKTVNKMLRNKGLIPEKKTFDAFASDVAIDILGEFFNLSNVADGENFYERQGTKIQVTKIELDLVLYMNKDQVGTVNYDLPLVGLLVDQQPNGGNPAEVQSEPNAASLGSDAPYITGADAAGILHTMAFKNPLMSHRYRYLKTWDFIFQGNDWEYVTVTGSTTTPAYNNQILKKLRYVKHFKTPIEIFYDDTAGSVASIVTNNICFCVMPITDENVGVSYHSRITYTDC